MTQMKFLIFALITSIVISSCVRKKKNDSPHPSEFIIVNLKVEDDIEIFKIVLHTDDGRDSITKEDIENKKEFELQAQQIGEGNFSICVFTKTDTLCSQDEYVEGGYRPKLILKNKKYEVLNSFENY
jgi:hypothetical protein